MLEGEARTQFENLHSSGMAAKDSGDNYSALTFFERADELAISNDDQPKRLDALQPAARALWSMGRYDEATTKIDMASAIASELGLTDEQGMIASNLGRLIATKVVKSIPVEQVAEALRNDAVPKFQEAFDLLKGHDHLYFRLANAQHGSVVSALAGNRKLSTELVKEGLAVAFIKSPEPYDQVRTFSIDPENMALLGVASALIPLGSKTPYLAKLAFNKLIR
jgi:tetratricopeptide (TPR) repeat protein